MHGAPEDGHDWIRLPEPTHHSVPRSAITLGPANGVVDVGAVAALQGRIRVNRHLVLDLRPRAEVTMDALEMLFSVERELARLGGGLWLHIDDPALVALVMDRGHHADGPRLLIG